MRGLEKGRIAIPAIYETPIGKPLGLTPFELMTEAALGALGKIGLQLSDVDACLTSPVLGPPTTNSLMSVAWTDYTGLRTSFETSINCGGGSTMAMLEVASSLILSGRAETILCVHGASNLQTQALTPDPESTPALEQRSNQAMMVNPNFVYPYGAGLPQIYALIARRHMHEFGTTPEQVAQVVVTAREWARLAPPTKDVEPLTVEAILASPMAVDPYHELELLGFVNGCAACVITSADRGRELNERAPLILGLGMAYHFLDLTTPDSIAENGAVRAAADKAFATAGVGPGDVNMFANYDAYPMTQIIGLESLGFAEVGKGGAFVAEGHTAPGGKLPTSTNGGMMVQGHPVLSGGMYSLSEGITQLQGEGGKRQVPDCEIVAHCSYIGSSGGSGVVILGLEA